MAEQLTYNYKWTKPDPGASPNTWGTTQNSSLDAVDAQVFANQSAISGLTGGTYSAATNSAYALVLNKASVSSGAYIMGELTGVSRWVLELGDATAETGGNVGSNFAVYRYDDTGAIIDAPFTINRANGTVGAITFSATTLIANGGTTLNTLTANGGTTLNTLTVNNAARSNGVLTAASDLNVTGTINAYGAVVVSGAMSVSGQLTMNNGTCNGTWNIGTANITTLAAGTLQANGAAYFAASTAGTSFTIGANSGARFIQFSPQWAFDWNTSGGLLAWQTPNGAVLQVDGSGNLTLPLGNGFKPGGGPWAAVSDERTKQDVAPYSGGLDQILKLLPIAFRYNGKGGTRDDGKTYYGLSGQAVKPVMPELTVEMEGEEQLDGQIGTDLGPLTLALVNAVKTLTERIRVLEAR